MDIMLVVLDDPFISFFGHFCDDINSSDCLIVKISFNETKSLSLKLNKYCKDVKILLGMSMQGRRRRNEVMRLPFKSHHATHNTRTEGAPESSCLSDAGLIALSVGFPNLEKLSLIWCSNISSQGLTSLAEKCKFLKSLDLQVIHSLVS